MTFTYTSGTNNTPYDITFSEDTECDILVVGAGGGGGHDRAGGGGSGACIYTFHIYLQCTVMECIYGMYIYIPVHSLSFTV